MSPTNTSTIFIAEDHAFVRKAIADLLRQRGYQIIGEVGNLTDTLARCRELSPDVILLDLGMPSGETPNLNGPDTIKQLIKDRREAKIVVLSMYKSLPSITTAYKAGAMAYVTKEKFELLFDAIETVLRGEKYLMPHISEQLTPFLMEPDIDPRTVLTKQELALFVLLASDKTYEEAAPELGVTVKSVANRATGIRKELHCDTDTKFKTIAQQYHLIKLDV